MSPHPPLNKTAQKAPFGLLATLLCVVLLLVPTLNAAIVANGDFEDNLVLGPVNEAPLTNWSPTGSADTQIFGHNTTLTYGVAPQSGTIAVVFSSTASAPANSMGSISQTLTTDNTKQYNLALWVSNPVHDPDARLNLFSIYWNGAPVDLTLWNSNFAVPNPSNPSTSELAGAPGTYVLAGDTAWFLLYIQNLTPGSGTTTNLTISAQNNDYVTLVDNVDVQETPEPSSVIMFCIGAGIVGLRRRRAQRAA
jgi:hypothetical protein